MGVWLVEMSLQAKSTISCRYTSEPCTYMSSVLYYIKGRHMLIAYLTEKLFLYLR